MPVVEKSDDSVASLIDVDSPHVSSVPSDFESQSVKTDTQAERIDREAEAREAREKAQEAAEKAKAKAARGGQYARANSDNPVVLGNALWVADSVLLLMSGWVAPTSAGYAFVIAQALVVLMYAEFQYVGLRRSTVAMA